TDITNRSKITSNRFSSKIIGYDQYSTLSNLFPDWEYFNGVSKQTDDRTKNLSKTFKEIRATIDDIENQLKFNPFL
ncbi:MAG: hypothetical protein MHPSP_001291, partial [Paramarteilia canceri]